MTLSNKSVAFITGAGSGIGRALAIGLAKEGIKGLALSDINSANLEETVAKLSDSDVQVTSATADVANREDMDRLKDSALSEHGRVTHLFNNAGVGLVGQTEEVSLDDMEWLMNVNFWGTVYPTKIFLPEFRKHDEGHIINISSVFGLIAPPGQATYCASKFAVRGFTESLRHELAGTGISVTCVHPGGIRTNIAKTARKAEAVSEDDRQMMATLFKKMSPTMPETAAQTIIKGVKSKSPRVLIGNDALQISAIQRMFPKTYFKVLDRLSGGMLSKLR